MFWDGTGADELVQQWIVDREFRVGDGFGEWGHVAAAGNGSSGRPVRDKVLAKLGIRASETWFTDAVNQFFVKRGGRRQQQGDVLDRVYVPFAQSAGLLPATLPRRPSPTALIRLAVAQHSDRIRRDILEADAPIVLTLGEEARHVMATIADKASGPPLTPLERGVRIESSYGKPGEVNVDGHRVGWYALVHPGNRETYWADLHNLWGDRQADEQAASLGGVADAPETPAN